MHIWSAQVQAKPGRGGETGAKVAEIRDLLVSVLGRPAWAWAVVAGAPAGSFMLSSRLDGTADLVDAQMQLAGNAGYQSLAATAADLWAAPTEMLMNRVVATTGEPSEPKSLIQATRATIAMGHGTDAMALATEIQEHVTKVTGHGGILAMSTAGAMFQVTWIMGFDSAADLDAASEAVAADADYAALLGKGGGLFVDGSAERFIMMQMP